MTWRSTFKSLLTFYIMISLLRFVSTKKQLSIVDCALDSRVEGVLKQIFAGDCSKMTISTQLLGSRLIFVRREKGAVLNLAARTSFSFPPHFPRCDAILKLRYDLRAGKFQTMASCKFSLRLIYCRCCALKKIR